MNAVGLSPSLEKQVHHQAPPISLPYKPAIGLTVLLIVGVIALYFPVIHHPFANIDDQGYVFENLHVQAGLSWGTIKWALTTFDDSNWHPLTWISHAIDCQLFGIDPAGHHAMNMIWHAIDAATLFWVLLLATGFVGRSFMVAALFAVHPLNVESVAWMAERKTMVSTLFFLLALGAYRWYAKRPKLGGLRYDLVALLFVLGLMGKPQIITLPCVFLLWDYWPLRRMFPGEASIGDAQPPLPPKSLWFLIKEKIPFFGICLASALITMKAQHVGRPQYWPYSLKVRVANSVVAYVRYVGKAFWPSHLSLMYLHPGNTLKFWQYGGAALLLLVITVLVIKWRRYRYLPVGWFWFLGTLVPTIGLVQVGRQAMADRYAYQSCLGLFIIVCWGVADLAKQKQLPRMLLPTVSVIVIAALGVVTHRQIGYWQDNLTLWNHALQVTDKNWVAEDMVAGMLYSQGHHDEAIEHYRNVAAIVPNDAGSNLAIAIYEQNHGNPQDSIKRYKRAIAGMDDPLEQAKAYQNMGLAYRDLGDQQKAGECFNKAEMLRRKK